MIDILTSFSLVQCLHKMSDNVLKSVIFAAIVIVSISFPLILFWYIGLFSLLIVLLRHANRPAQKISFLNLFFHQSVVDKAFLRISHKSLEWRDYFKGLGQIGYLTNICFEMGFVIYLFGINSGSTKTIWSVTLLLEAVVKSSELLKINYIIFFQSNI